MTLLFFKLNGGNGHSQSSALYGNYQRLSSTVLFNTPHPEKHKIKFSQLRIRKNEKKKKKELERTSFPEKNKCTIIHQITIISINILPSSPLGYRVDWNHFILKSLPGIVLGILKTIKFTWTLYVYPHLSGISASIIESCNCFSKSPIMISV